MTYRDEMVRLADTQVGYTEGKDNHNKYAQYFDTPKSKGGPYPWFNGKKQNVAWCAIFVCWLFVMVLQKVLGGTDAVRVWLGCPKPADNCAAAVPYLWKYLVAKGWKIDKTKGKKGDIIFLNGNKHVGIIEYVEDGYYHTIEGNKNNSVARGQYKIGSSYIYGIISPDYESLGDMPDTQQKPEPTPAKPETPAAPVQTTKKYQVICKRGLNVRTGPGTRYTDVGNLNYGQTVTVYETKDNWARIGSGRWACIKMNGNVYMKAV